MLKKTLLTVGILFAGLCAFLGITWLKDTWPIESTSLKNEEIGKLAIGLDESQISRYYTEFATRYREKETAYYYDDEANFIVHTDTETKEITCIELRDTTAGQNFTTKRGIGIGSSPTHVKREYGTNYRQKNTELYGDLIEFQDDRTNQKMAFGIDLSNEKVTVVVLFNYKKFRYPY
ncbi:hypothetical protein [Listeria booriae]|uniref:hypothetical protein n=1 Tax=Listeria booriae TaxID=1552123 RepID=UPI00164DB5FC|nr:hypothetical protein [Listeria booriae]MBC6152694.1 hypothetical protein [Listeria booriae]MBC6305380.1 hypothetical protein [Listeria booriae]